MNETEKKQIAQKFITGLSNRDANLLKSIMTDDVVWSLPGKSLMSGEAHGVDAILRLPQAGSIPQPEYRGPSPFALAPSSPLAQRRLSGRVRQ